MGLDSVELVMDIEKAFSVRISDKDAENIGTIEEMVTWLYHHLEIHQPENQLKNQLLEEINRVLKEMNLIERDTGLSEKLSQIIPQTNLANHWKTLEQKLELTLPELSKKDFGIEVKEKKLLGWTFGISKPPLLENTMERLVDCVGGLNYEKLVDFNQITSTFEIFIAVMGITQYKSGVAIEKIFWESSFTGDLGID
ncbi:MAG: hypothetical protein H7Y04_02300 [Verrucomicrobia bacterium]|nr:hypothetical protein [Cytophagales bacterium]